MMKIIYSILSLFICVVTLSAQSKDNYMRAMRSEIVRNMSELRLEKMPAPFIIAYSIADVTNVVVEGGCNAIFCATTKRTVKPETTVITGDYHTTNSKSWGSVPLREAFAPLDYNYDELRRILWECTDIAYKQSAQQLLERRRYIKQQNVAKEVLDIPDTYKLSPVKREMRVVSDKADLEKCKKYIVTLLAELEKCKQIKEYYVKLVGNVGTVYKCSSEGVEFVSPVSQYSISISISCLDSCMVEYRNQLDLNAVSIEKMPDIDVVSNKIQQLYNITLASTTAKKLEDSYFGPILLQDKGVCDFFEKWLTADFINNKGYAYDQNAKLQEGKLGKRITALGLNAVNYSSLDTFNGVNLWGSFDIDADGITPTDSIELLNNGVLINLLNDRFCSKKIRSSNGYNRIRMTGSNGGSISPSVLKIYSNEGSNDDRMKLQLIEAAKKEGLEYAYRVVRFVRNSSVASEIYRVYVSDGREEMVSPSNVNFNKSSLRRINAVSANSNAYNIDSNGIAVTYIVPNSLIIDEVEIDIYAGVNFSFL